MGFTDKQSGPDRSSINGISGSRERFSTIYQVILAQAVATLVISASFLLLGTVSAYSSLLGGLICVMPNGYLAYRLSATDGLSQAQRTGRMVQGEIGKLVQTAVFFAMVFLWVRPLDPLILFCSFIGVQVLHWLVPLCIRRA